MNTATLFQSNLRELLGVDTGSKAVATSSSVAMFTGATVTAGAAAASGTYALTYTKSGSTGTFRISDGNNVYTATATASGSMSTTVTVGNFSIALSSFDGSESLANQAMFKVTNTSNMTMTGQIDSESTDTLSVVFSSTNASSLSLSGGDIKSKANAATAQTNLKSAASTISNLVAQLGGKRSQLDFQIENLKISQANNAAAKSAVVDTNIAEATDRLMKFKSLSSIANSVFSQAIQNTQNLADLLARL
jgi:flagellin-like hook-associated protein FlgL